MFLVKRRYRHKKIKFHRRVRGKSHFKLGLAGAVCLLLLMTFAYQSSGGFSFVGGNPNPTPTPSPIVTPSPTPWNGGGGGGGPTPTPTVTPQPTTIPTGNNIASFESGFWSSSPGSNTYRIWNNGANPYIQYPVSFSGKTDVLKMLLNPDTKSSMSADDRELDGNAVEISPGDHIFISYWMYMPTPTLAEQSGAQAGDHGGLMAIDIYGHAPGYYTGGQDGTSAGNFRIADIGEPTQVIATYNYVPWGSNGWVYREYSFTMPNTVACDTWGNTNVPKGYPCVPVWFIPWIVGNTYSWGSLLTPPTQSGTEQSPMYVWNPVMIITH